MSLISFASYFLIINLGYAFLLGLLHKWGCFVLISFHRGQVIWFVSLLMMDVHVDHLVKVLSADFSNCKLSHFSAPAHRDDFSGRCSQLRYKIKNNYFVKSILSGSKNGIDLRMYYFHSSTGFSGLSFDSSTRFWRNTQICGVCPVAHGVWESVWYVK